MGISVDQVKQAQTAGKARYVTSIDKPIGDDSGSRTLADIILLNFNMLNCNF